jgi:hypothetical protein
MTVDTWNDNEILYHSELNNNFGQLLLPVFLATSTIAASGTTGTTYSTLATVSVPAGDVVNYAFIKFGGFLRYSGGTGTGYGSFKITADGATVAEGNTASPTELGMDDFLMAAVQFTPTSLQKSSGFALAIQGKVTYTSGTPGITASISGLEIWRG